MRDFTKQQVEEAFKQANFVITKMARILHTRAATAKQLLIKFEVPFEITNNKMKNISKEEIEKVYNEFDTIKEMAQKFGINVTIMRKHLYKHNLHKPLHHSFDQDFFLKRN